LPKLFSKGESRKQKQPICGELQKSQTQKALPKKQSKQGEPKYICICKEGEREREREEYLLSEAPPFWLRKE
jgi:hypothetical protein